mmetsp:Transcript_12816/g.31213  ORF Transcript_12816/g.31213 Transcript_12816/m.31213 type:complete len:261 (+) Transcript_12816:565-1347(+)
MEAGRAGEGSEGGEAGPAGKVADDDHKAAGHGIHGVGGRRRKPGNRQKGVPRVLHADSVGGRDDGGNGKRGTAAGGATNNHAGLFRAHAGALGLLPLPIHEQRRGIDRQRNGLRPGWVDSHEHIPRRRCVRAARDPHLPDAQGRNSGMDPAEGGFSAEEDAGTKGRVKREWSAGRCRDAEASHCKRAEAESHGGDQRQIRTAKPARRVGGRDGGSNRKTVCTAAGVRRTEHPHAAGKTTILLPRRQDAVFAEGRSARNPR